MQHHPIFDDYTPYCGPRPEGEAVDFIGARFKGLWWGNDNIPAFESIRSCGLLGFLWAAKRDSRLLFGGSLGCDGSPGAER
jgi:hypothetical protein